MREKIEALASRVDLEEDPETSTVSMLGKKKHFICGTSMPTITIPIIPISTPANGREYLGFGQFVPYGEEEPLKNPCSEESRRLTSEF